MITSIALRCSAVKSAAPTVPGSNSARNAPNPSAAARSQARARSDAVDRRKLNDITETPVQRGPAGSIVEILRLAVNILGAGIGRRILRQQLLRAIGLLRGVLFLAVRERFLSQRQCRQAHLIVAAIGDREEMPDLALPAFNPA